MNAPIFQKDRRNQMSGERPVTADVPNRDVANRDDRERSDLRSISIVIQREPGVSRQNIRRQKDIGAGYAPLSARQADQTTGHTVGRADPRNMMTARLVRSIQTGENSRATVALVLGG